MPHRAHRHQSQRHRGNLPDRDPLVEHVIQIVQVALMIAKVRHHMRVRFDETRRARGHHQRRNPAMPLRQLHRRQPDAFLIVQNVRHKAPPSRLSLHRRPIRILRGSGHRGRCVRQGTRAAVSFTVVARADVARAERLGSRRRTVRTTHIDRLRRRTARCTPRARAQEETKK